MKLVASKPARLHCPICDVTYNLPAVGSFKVSNHVLLQFPATAAYIWFLF